MKLIKLTLFLAVVSAISACALAYTYSVTKEKMEEEKAKAKKAALQDIFFELDFEKVLVKEIKKDSGCNYIYAEKNDKTPKYYSAPGAGIGYNSAVKIELVVGFSKTEKGFVCEGWKVVKSEETPGLGENAKNQKAAATWAEILTGNAKEAGPDKRTKFQKQFKGLAPSKMIAKETIDTITAATISTNGIIKAIQNAEKNLQAALGK